MSQPTRSPAASDEPPSRRGGEDGGNEQYTDNAYLLSTREPETTETKFTFLGIKFTIKSVTRVGSDNNGADAYVKVGLTTAGITAVPMVAGAMLGAAPELSLLSGTGLGAVTLLLYYAFWGRRQKPRSPEEPRGSTS